MFYKQISQNIWKFCLEAKMDQLLQLFSSFLEMWWAVV